MSNHKLSEDQKQDLQEYYASELRELNAAKTIDKTLDIDIQVVEKNIIAIVMLLIQQRKWNWTKGTGGGPGGSEFWTLQDEEGEYTRLRVSITTGHIAVDNYNIYGDFNILMNILNLKGEIAQANDRMGGKRLQLQTGRRVQSVLGEMHNK